LIEGRWEHFFDAFDQDECQFIPHFLRHVFQILPVRLRQKVWLRCCLFHPDFCPMTGRGQDSNQPVDGG
jgi:hypothetical protein